MADDKTIYVTFEFQGNLGNDVDMVTEKIRQMDTTASKALQEMAKGSSLSARGILSQADAIGMLPAPLKAANSGFGKLIQATRAFIATPVGIVLTAIVAALQALFSWFNSSAEGQMEFARVSGYVSGVLGQLKEVVLQVGEAIYKAFNDPKAAVKALWEEIKKNIVNRIQGVGDMFKALGKIISSGFTEGFDELTEASLKVATGVDHARERMKAYAATVHDAAKKTAELSVAGEKLARDRSNRQKREAELDVKAEELRSRMYTAGDKERLQLAKEYKAVVKEQYDQRRKFLTEELRIKKETDALTTNSQADYDKDNELEARLIRLNAEEQQALRFVNRQEGSILRKGGGGGNDAAKALEEQLKRQKAYQRDWEKNQLDFAQKQIDLLNDSYYKQRQQAELNKKKELAAIKQQQEDRLKDKREAYGKGATLSEEETTYFKNLVDLAERSYKKSAAEIDEAVNGAFKEGRLRFADELAVQLADIEGYYKERLRMAENNEELIAELTAAKEKEITLAKNNYTAEMLDYDIEITRKRLANAESFYRWEADRRKKQLEEERRVQRERLRLMEEQYKLAPTDKLAKEIALAREELEGLNKELSRIPTQKLSEVLGAFQQIASSLGGLSGSVGEAFSSIASSLSAASEMLSKDMSTTQGKVSAISTAISGTVAMINMVTAAAEKRRTVEKAFYKNAIAFAHEYALSLNEQLRLQSKSGAFVRNYAGEIKDSFRALNNAMDGYSKAIGKLHEGKANIKLRNAIDGNNVAKGAATGALAGTAIGTMIMPGIGTAIGAVVGTVGGLIAGIFSKKKKKVTDDLMKVFPNLVDEAGNLNKELAQTLINTDQVDDKTKQLLQNALDWQDAVKKAEDSLGEIATSLAGDIGNNLRNAIVGAWKAGEDASKAMFATASDSLEGFITQLLYSAIFSDVFEDFKKNLVESLKPGGDQDVLDDFDKLMNEMTKRDDQYVELLNKVKKRAKDRGYTKFGEKDDKAKDGRTGTTKGIQSITQDTATAIEGRLTALLIYQDAIKLSVGGINQTLVAGVAILTEIRDNTSHCQRLEQIESGIGSMKRELETINSRGVTLRTA